MPSPKHAAFYDEDNFPVPGTRVIISKAGRLPAKGIVVGYTKHKMKVHCTQGNAEIRTGRTVIIGLGGLYPLSKPEYKSASIDPFEVMSIAIADGQCFVPGEDGRWTETYNEGRHQGAALESFPYFKVKEDRVEDIKARAQVARTVERGHRLLADYRAAQRNALKSCPPIQRHPHAEWISTFPSHTRTTEPKPINTEAAHLSAKMQVPKDLSNKKQEKQYIADSGSEYEQDTDTEASPSVIEKKRARRKRTEDPKPPPREISLPSRRLRSNSRDSGAMEEARVVSNQSLITDTSHTRRMDEEEFPVDLFISSDEEIKSMLQSDYAARGSITTLAACLTRAGVPTVNRYHIMSLAQHINDEMQQMNCPRPRSAKRSHKRRRTRRSA